MEFIGFFVDRFSHKFIVFAKMLIFAQIFVKCFVVLQTILRNWKFSQNLFSWNLYQNFCKKICMQFSQIPPNFVKFCMKNEKRHFCFDPTLDSSRFSCLKSPWTRKTPRIPDVTGHQPYHLLAIMSLHQECHVTPMAQGDIISAPLCQRQDWPVGYLALFLSF